VDQLLRQVEVGRSIVCSGLVGNDCQFVVDELEANEAVEVMWLLWLTVELGTLLWPVSSALHVDGGCWLQMCRTAVRWSSPVATTHVSDHADLWRRV